MTDNKQNEAVSTTKLLQPIFTKVGMKFTKDVVMSKLGRMFTFRELSWLTRQQLITNDELAFYMRMKSNTEFNELQVEKLELIHLRLTK